MNFIQSVMQRFFGIACGLLATVSINAYAQGSGEQMPLRIQVFPGNVANLYPMLGVARGFYKEAGLDVQLVQIGSGPQASAALVSKSVDMILTSPDNALVLKARGFHPVAVVGVTTKPNFILIARDPASYPNLSKGYPELMNDFSNRKVAIYAPGSASERFVKFLLRGAGKSEKTVQFVNAGGPGQASAGLIAKQVDIASDVFSVGVTAELSGYGKIILDCSVSPCPPSISTPGAMGLAYFTSKSFIESNEKTVKALVLSHQRINQWMHDANNKAALRAEIEKIAPAPVNVDSVKYFDAITNWAIRFFDVTFAGSAFEASQNGMLSAGDLKERVSLDGLIWPGLPTR